MNKQKIIITFTALVGVILIASPMIWAKTDNNPGVPFQALWDAINDLQAQIEAIELIPGPKGDPGDPGPPGESGITEVLTKQHYFPNPGLDSPITASTPIPNTDFHVSISKPTDVVVLFTAEILPPNVTPDEYWEGLRIEIEYQQGFMNPITHRAYWFTGNGIMQGWEKAFGIQANIHSVIHLSDPGDYTIQLRWLYFSTSSTAGDPWKMKTAETTLLIH